MNNELRYQIYNNFDSKETDELLEIWKTNDHVEWSDLAFEILEEILMKRIGELPVQNDAIFEYKDKEDVADKLEDWEVKLLGNENQPEFYDTLEVLSLKDDINKLVKAVIFVKIGFAIVNFQTVQGILQGYFPSTNQMPAILWSLLLTILAVGIDIAIVYFPLKALAHILRILMEMEFNSRKAKS